MKSLSLSFVTLLSALLLIGGCSSSNNNQSAGPSDGTNAEETSDAGDTTDSGSTVDVGGTNNSDGTDNADGTDIVVGAIDINQFIDGALLQDATIVDCTLSDGVETTCYELAIQGTPAGDAEIGPFCPENITTGADEAGIWFDGGGQVYDVDGEFIVNLPNLYGDQNWNLYDADTGLVKVTTTQAACEGAAQPNVEEQYRNMCVECSIDYYGGGISQTVLIPVTPVLAEAPGAISGDVGIAINGVVLAAPAPVADILSHYTIAAFDDCGGHVNPNAGYHYHASTDCNSPAEQADGHAPLMGYAMDGYAIYAHLDADGNEHTDLDECRGATDDTRGYHYHAASAWENTFIGCFSGQTEGVDTGPGQRPPR